jgi:hypothetical protein
MGDVLAKLKGRTFFPLVAVALGTGMRRGSSWRCAGRTSTLTALKSESNAVSRELRQGSNLGTEDPSRLADDIAASERCGSA